MSMVLDVCFARQFCVTRSDSYHIYVCSYTRPKLRTLGPIEFSRECPPKKLKPGTLVKAKTWVMEVFPEELKDEENPYGVGDSFGCVMVTSDTEDLDVCWCDGEQEDIPMKFASICPPIGATVEGTTRRLTVKRYWKKGIACWVSLRQNTDDADKTVDAANKTADAADQTTDGADKTVDGANKTTDSVNKPADAANKTADAADQATDGANKTTDDADKTTDAAKKRKPTKLHCEPVGKKKKSTKTKDHTPVQGTPPKSPRTPGRGSHWKQRRSPDKPRPDIKNKSAYMRYLKYDAQAHMMRENPELFQQYVSVACAHIVHSSSPE